jgi:Rod binding domain-containing protein
MNPYTPQKPLMMDNMQDVSGQRPVFMNESAQEQMHRALLQQNLGSPVGQGHSLGINPMALAQMLRQGQKAPYGGTPQGAYGQQGQYMQDAMNPVTSQQQMLMNQGGPEFMSFNTPFAG